jgi:hypothetical protein
MGKWKDSNLEGMAHMTGAAGAGAVGAFTYNVIRAAPRTESLRGGVLESISNNLNAYYHALEGRTSYNLFLVSEGQGSSSLPAVNLPLWIAGTLGLYAGYQLPKHPFRGLIAGTLAATIPMVTRTINQVPETVNYMLQSSQMISDQASQYGPIASVVIPTFCAGLAFRIIKEIFDGERALA